ncbi:MAG: alpha/beta fold hydrolase [Beijerinckiaceae bacterium]
MPDTGSSSAPMWREAIIETSGFALREREAGDGHPVICLGFDEPEASRLLDDLAGCFRLVALSPAAVPLGGEPDLDSHALASETLACADRLGLQRFCILARGDEDHVALCLAIRAPERVGCVALLAPDLHSRDGAAEDAALIDRLGEVKAPVLALFGALDRAASSQTARLWGERIPRCRIALAPGAGRDVDVERPHHAAKMIAEFLGPK